MSEDFLKKYDLTEEESVKYRQILSEAIKSKNLENIFTQGLFGGKIPLFTEYDFINDCDHKVIYYFELPHLEKYGSENLFALRYMGEDVPQMCIKHDSILIFKRCTEVTCNGVYAVVSRNTLKFKQAAFTSHGLYITPLDDKKRLPKICKSASAAGVLVSCINNY